MERHVFLSIIIPTFNEEPNISGTLSEVSEYLGERDLSYEIIIVDDGSGDMTVKKVGEFGEKLQNLRIIESSPNRGKGYVLRKAIFQSGGEYVMFMDADSSTSVYEMDKFLPLLKEKYDVYIASRRIPGSEVRVPVERKAMGNIYILLSRIMLGIRVSDLNCGFKMFTQEAAKKIFSMQVMDDWSFDAEVLFLCEKYGYRIKEIPVKWVHKTTSKVRPLRDGINSFLSLITIKQNDLRGKYPGPVRTT